MLKRSMRMNSINSINPINSINSINPISINNHGRKNFRD